MSDQLDWNRLPHYNVGGKRFLRILDAIKEMKETGSSYRFSFLEGIWDGIDWTNEPTESWEDLCRERAVQIRAKCDWLRIWYSGGRDSLLALTSFLDNNIKVDEVVVVNNPYDLEKNHDINTVTLPSARQLLFNKNIKLTEYNLEISDWQRTFSRYWTEKGFGGLAGHNAFLPCDYTEYIRHRPDIFTAESNSNLRVSNVMGLDKPKIRIRNGWIETYFQDSPFRLHMYDNEDQEYFYFSPDLPQLHVKQTWMLVNYLKKNYQHKPLDWLNKFTSAHKWGLGPKFYDEYCTAIGRPPAISIRTGFGLDKSDPFCDRYMKMYNHKELKSLPEMAHWKDTMAQITKHYGDFFTDHNAFAGPIGILSKSYQLAPWNYPVTDH
jgi:hypothetical protein